MRLWHQKLIPYLPDCKTSGNRKKNQLPGLHRELCALRGLGWKKKHSTIDYIKNYSFAKLVQYHFLVIDELEKRGYKIDEKWNRPNYRGKQIGYDDNLTNTEFFDEILNESLKIPSGKMIYPEHNDEYLKECIKNLKNKGVEIDYV